MFDLDSYLIAGQALTNEALNEILDSSIKSARLVEAMRYSLMAGGKRLRPILCMAATEAVGGNGPDVLKPACALELIHTYSLIHDDLPAMDDDNLRRGNPTNHVAFDEATAILAGDALLTLAFQVLSSHNGRTNSSDHQLLQIIHIISQAVGYKGMVGGQMRDIESEKTELSLNELKEMHTLKTGALIEASVRTGAILGNGSQEQIRRLKIYSKNIGLAFQVVDDILDVEGDPTLMGKAVGADQHRNKNTYPSLLGLEASKALSIKLVNKALQAVEFFDIKSDPLRAIATYIIERKK